MLLRWIRRFILWLLAKILGTDIRGAVQEAVVYSLKKVQEEGKLPEPKQVAQVKCYTRTFHYTDGSSKTFHTVCDGKTLAELTPEFGRSLVGQPETTRGHFYVMGEEKNKETGQMQKVVKKVIHNARIKTEDSEMYEGVAMTGMQDGAHFITSS